MLVDLGGPQIQPQHEALRRFRLKKKEKCGGFLWSLSSVEQQQRWCHQPKWCNGGGDVNLAALQKFSVVCLWSQVLEAPP